MAKQPAPINDYSKNLPIRHGYDLYRHLRHLTLAVAKLTLTVRDHDGVYIGILTEMHIDGDECLITLVTDYAATRWPTCWEILQRLEVHRGCFGNNEAWQMLMQSYDVRAFFKAKDGQPAHSRLVQFNRKHLSFLIGETSV